MFSFVLSGILANPWRAVAIGITVVMGLWVGLLTIQTNHYKAKAVRIEAEYEGFKLKVAQLGEAAEADKKRKEAQQKEASNNVAKAYEARIADLRRRYAGMRASNPGGGRVPEVPDPAAVADAAAADPVRAGQCAETTQQLISLQDWINLQQQVK